jgi:hypothetical protein
MKWPHGDHPSRLKNVDPTCSSKTHDFKCWTMGASALLQMIANTHHLKKNPDITERHPCHPKDSLCFWIYNIMFPQSHV